MIQFTPDGIVINVHVIPRSSRSELAGARGDRLLVRLTAPPVDGAANAALIDLIAAAFGVPRRAVTIVTGERSRQKRVRVLGVDAATAQARLLKDPRRAGLSAFTEAPADRRSLGGGWSAPRDAALKGPRDKG